MYRSIYLDNKETGMYAAAMCHADFISTIDNRENKKEKSGKKSLLFCAVI